MANGSRRQYSVIADEGSGLISERRREDAFVLHKRSIAGFILLAAFGLSALVLLMPNAGSRDVEYDSALDSTPLLGKSREKEELPITPPEAERRCEWVAKRFHERDAGASEEELRARYAKQVVDANVFYRATAHLFWRDFVDHGWEDLLLSTLDDISLHGGVPLEEGRRSTAVWVTGDQHCSNFGAWRNRNGEVVFTVNDFDEAAIYSFHVDVLRIAVSVCSHGFTNGLSGKKVDKALGIFANSYVKTVIGYIGNEDALLFELSSDTAKGELKDFLKKVEKKNSASNQLQKFTEEDPATGLRHFIKGGIDVPHSDTRLASVPPEVEKKIVDAFTPTRYGATMMKVGWKVKEWDDDFFTVLDVAERLGSGVGSSGVDRYYVLLKGTDGLLGEDGEDGNAVILDVKFEPTAAVERVLSTNDKAWYDVMFSNRAERVVQAQRRLTSYVDPYTGWILLEDEDGTPQPFYIRQRSPWKDSMDLDKLTDPDDFYDFVSQIAVATATAHVRGTVGKAPGDFKHVIQDILGKKSNRKEWASALALLARAYREQVLLDFQCFQEFVEANYGGATNTTVV